MGGIARGGVHCSGDGDAPSKKNELRPHLQKQWVIPPQQNAEFVAHMEDTLEVYERLYDARRPQLCLDEQLVELVRETRTPLPMKPGQVPRYDYEYQPAGTAVNFLVVEPLTGWRKIVVRERKTAVDWAEVVRELLEVRFAVTLKALGVNIQRAMHWPKKQKPAEKKGNLSLWLDRVWEALTRRNGWALLFPNTGGSDAPGAPVRDRIQPFAA